VMDHLTDADLARLFRRSMPVSTVAPPFEPAAAGGNGTAT